MAVFTPTELKNAGFSAKQLNEDGGYTVEDLKNAGFTLDNLCKEGFQAKALKEGKYTPSDLRKFFSAGQLQDAGFSALMLKDAGFSAKDLK